MLIKPSLFKLILLISVATMPFQFEKQIFANEEGTSKSDRPNFIFIITDDQRWDALGVVQQEQADEALFPWFKSPNMDRIAREGARFRNAFVVHSLCSPSRASFLSGRPSHQHRVLHNQHPMPLDIPTWATGLRDAGYETAYFGKWHMGQQAKRPGFSRVVSYLGQGKYNNCHFYKDGQKIETTGWVDDVTTDFAVRYLEAEHDKPFGMVIGYKSPHEPRLPPDRHEETYSKVELKIPTSLEVIPPFRPPGYKPLPWKSRIYDRLNYFRCLSAVDDGIGKILDVLDRRKLTENTVLVFVGDNGYYLGEHASHDKRTAYEESIRIPFLIRYPKLIKPGTLIDDIVLNIDLAPTFLELANLPTPKLVGKSLLPVLKDPGTFEDRVMLYENYQDPEFSKVTFDIFALRTETHKLVTYPGHPQWTEAFDLQSDPLELSNIVDQPEFEEQRKLLVDQLKNQLEAASLLPNPNRD
ncbi:MAG: sulfatase-like hydrolase/transferase [Planctomycetota bacterium]